MSHDDKFARPHNDKYGNAHDDLRDISKETYKKFLRETYFKPWQWPQRQLAKAEYRSLRRSLRDLSLGFHGHSSEGYLQSHYSVTCNTFFSFQQATGIHLPFNGCNRVLGHIHLYKP